MRKVSKVLLSIFSSLGIAIILFELFAIFFALLIMVIDVVFDIVLIVLISTNAVPADTISALYSFASITDPFKLILSFYGVTDTPEYMVGMLVGDMVICILRPIVSIIAIIPHLIIVLVASILGFVGASKKAKKGTHLANVITGGFIAYFTNIILGAGFILGGIFAMNADKKEAEAEEKKNAPTTAIETTNWTVEEI